MSDNHRPHSDALDHATEALRDAPVPAGPPADLSAATLSAVQSRLAGTPPTEPSRSLLRRAKVMRYIRFGSAATAATVLAAVAFFALTPRPLLAMDKVLDKVKAAEAVSYTDTQTTPDGFTTEIKYFVRKDQTRVEIRGGKTTYVYDYAKRKALTFSTDLKAYEVFDLPEQPADTRPDSLAQEVQRLRGKKAAEGGTERAGTVDATVFEVEGVNLFDTTADCRLLVDPKTELPVKVVATRKPTDKDDALFVKRVFDQIEWNPELKDEQFSLDPPKGYKQGIPGFVKPPVK